MVWHGLPLSKDIPKGSPTFPKDSILNQLAPLLNRSHKNFQIWLCTQCWPSSEWGLCFIWSLLTELQCTMFPLVSYFTDSGRRWTEMWIRQSCCHSDSTPSSQTLRRNSNFTEDLVSWWDSTENQFFRGKVIPPICTHKEWNYKELSSYSWAFALQEIRLVFS